jgi:hypothetical protein
MSRRHAPRDPDAEDWPPDKVIEVLLDDLCLKFGFCLSPEDRAALKSDRPVGVHAFTDAVITAEGLDPLTLDSGLRRAMAELVELKAGRIL